MQDEFYGAASPELVAAFEAERRRKREENRARIAAGKGGDRPDPLTAEDEAILDRAWTALAREEADAARRAA